MTSRRSRLARRGLFLARMANRRATATRVAAFTAVVATFVGPLQVGFAGAQSPGKPSTGTLPDDVARRSSQRIRPASVTDVSGKLPADHLWRLFDGEAATGLEAWAPVQIRLTFAQPTVVDAIGAYGAAGGSLALLGPDGKGPGQGMLDLDAAVPRWARLPVAAAPATRSFVVAWTPRKGAAVLPELEIWGRAPGSSGDHLPDALYRAVPEGASTFTARQGERHVSASTTAEDRTFTFDLPGDPRAIDRAFLMFDLSGLPHFTAARRAINDGAPAGGFAVVRGAKGGLQVEEISPQALRTCRNTVRFDPVHASDPVGYRVSGLRLVTTHADEARALADTDDLNDGKEGTGWSNGPSAARHFRFGADAQPRELEFRLTKGREGTLKILGSSHGDSQQVTVDLAALRPGWHKVALDALPAVDAVSAVLSGGREGAVFLSELFITGSPLPVGDGRALRVSYPLHGECVDHRVHVRALLAGTPSEVTANGRPARGVELESGAFNFTATEKDLGGAGGKPFSVVLEARQRGGGVARAEIPIAGCADRPAPVAGAPAQPVEDAGAPYGMVVSSRKGGTLSFGGARVEVPPGAVDADARLTMRALPPGQLPPLDPGMTNVTAGGRAFRLGPHGMQFRRGVALTLPLDRARVDAADHPAVYYYDEKARHWQDVALLQEQPGAVIAETTHFTDFIAATVVLPEHPGLQALNPTSLKQLKAGDPAAGINQIAPPQPNSDGSAALSYPIEIPPGRRGMEPRLAIAYDSNAGNGWLGVGWDLPIPHIEIDTRFGVPKYDGTERYLLDGEELAPLTGPPSNAPPGTYYARRNEGKFDWIQRVPSNGSFYWVVTDKSGTKHTYGLNDNSRLMGLTATGTNDRVKTFRWCLELSEDIYGNQVRYGYASDPGLDADRFQQIYPANVSYTAVRGDAVPAAYSVVFNSLTDRTDKFTSGRAGFQVRTRRLLDTIDVKNGGTIIRKYTLAYKDGDFGKKLLKSVAVSGEGGAGTPLATHNFSYHAAPVASTSVPKIFGTPVNWSKFLNGDGTASNGSSFHDESQKELTFGTFASNPLFGNSSSHMDLKNSGERWVEDINGDGLADLLPHAVTDGNKQTLMTSADGLTPTSGLMSVQPGTDWNAPHSYEHNQHMTSSYNVLGFDGSADYGNVTEATQMLADIDGDGLPDRLYRDGDSPNALHVMLNRGEFNGFLPITDFTGFSGTGLSFDCKDIFAGSSLAGSRSGSSIGTTLPSFPSVDIVTKWEAPFTGNINITGSLIRQESGGDGMTAQLFLVNGSGTTTIWQRDIGPTEFTSAPGCVPAASNGCGSGLPIFVNQGDRLYTRVSGKNNTDHDVLSWDTTVTYTQLPSGELAAKESYGTLRYKFSEASDSRSMGQFTVPWHAIARGTVGGRVEYTKSVSADDIEFVLHLHRPSNPAADDEFVFALLPAATSVSTEFDIFPLNVEPGDEIHAWARSQLPIDPDSLQAVITLSYSSFCRTDAKSGNEYCGTPHCVPVNAAAGPNAGSACTIEPTPWTGVSTDPMAAHPVAGAMLTQIAPVYRPTERWVYQPWSTPLSTTPDGRKMLKTTTSNPSVQLCVRQGDFAYPNQHFTIAVQTVNGLIGKLDVDPGTFGTNDAGGACVQTPTTIPAGQQVFFSVYATEPFLGNYVFSASLGSTFVTSYIERYYRDQYVPTLSKYPGFGRAETMNGGFHGFFSGTWNGNYSFSENMIDPKGNENYVPLFVSPQPAAPLPPGTSAFLDGLVTGLVHAVSAAAKWAYDIGKQAVLISGGAYLERGIRFLSSLAGKIMAWSLCTFSNSGYTVVGMRYTETHSIQEGVALGGAGVSWTSGRTVGGMDLIDMNGDRYLDQVSTAGIRYLSYDPSQHTGSFLPATPVVKIPGSALRVGGNTMYSAQVSGSGQVRGESQSTDSGGKGNGVQVGGNIAFTISQGFARLSRDLRDVNGDGLPDLVESTATGLQVRLNYGYYFGNPTAWSTAAWPFPKVGPLFTGANVTSVLGNIASAISSNESAVTAIRLEETAHRGSNLGLSANYGPVGGGVGRGEDQTYVRTLTDLVDVNGDGLVDQVMKVPNDGYHVKLNTGTGFAAETVIPADPWPAMSSFWDTGGDAVTVDKVDTLSFSKVDTTDWTGEGSYFGFGGSLTRGSGEDKLMVSLMDIDGDGRVDHVVKNDSDGRVWARLNQVGKSNLLSNVTLPMGGSIALDYGRAGNVVGSFPTASGRGVRAEMPDTRWVLSKITVKDGRANSATDQIDTLDYRAVTTASASLVPSGIYDRGEREFTGFGQVNITHRDGSAKLLYFVNGSYIGKGALLAEYDINADKTAARGSFLNRSFVTTPGAAPSGTLSSSYVENLQTYDVIYDGRVTRATIEANSPFALLSNFVATPADGSIVHLAVRGVDSNGNLVSLIDYGDTASAADDVKYTVVPAVFSGQHFTGVDTVNALRMSDSSLVQKRSSTYVVTGGRPELTQVNEFVFGGNQPGGVAYTGQSSSYIFTYDTLTGNFGNLETYKDPSGYQLKYTYDAATRSHVATVTDSFGLVSSTTWDPKYGVPLTTTDANDQVVTYAYDTYGRLSKVFGPGDPTTGTPTIEVVYSLPATVVSSTALASSLVKHKDASGTIDTYSFADGLGRVIQTKKEAEAMVSGVKQLGYTISGQVLFDTRGRLMSQSQPRFITGSTGFTTFSTPVTLNATTYSYDGANRTTVVSAPDLTTTSTRYATVKPGLAGDDGLATAGTVELTAVTDANGHVHRTYRDGAGRVVAVKEFNAIRATRKALLTRYGYDLQGNVGSVTDPLGNIVSAIYDSLNRMVRLTSPDTGTTEYRYNLNGLLAETQTANLRGGGQLIKYGYDQNRLTTITYPTSPAVTYAYGQAGEKGSGNGNIGGRIKTVTMEGGKEDRRYDAFGNVAQTTTTLKHINNTTLASPVAVMKYSYDWLGRMRTMTFPQIVDINWNIPAGDGEVVTYNYDQGGLLKSITGNSGTVETYVADIGYDEFGQRAMLKSGNNIVTTYTYDPKRRFLKTVNATAAPSTGSVAFNALTYAYDNIGNVKSITNAPPDAAIRPDTATVGAGPMTVSYGYDEQDQLITSTAKYRGFKTRGYRYSTTFDYDEIGNMIKKAQTDVRLLFLSSDVGLNGGTDSRTVPETTYTLVPTPATGKAHQPATVAETSATGAVQTRTVRFDLNGNQTGDTLGTTTRTLTWNEENRLKQVQVGSTVKAAYLYSPEGERTQRMDASGKTTFYVNQFLVLHGDKNVTKHIFAGESRLVSKTASNQTTPIRHFYHPDHLGSTAYITDQSQTLVQHERYFPFGESWIEQGFTEQTGTQRRDWLFTSKELDRVDPGTNTNYYYFGARYYDPRAAGWMSPDPILARYMRGEINGGVLQPRNLGLYAYAWSNPVMLQDPDGAAVGENFFVRQVKGMLGAGYGALKAVVPGGFLAPQPGGTLANDSDFLAGQAAGEATVGSAEVFGGGILTAGGIVAEGPSLGTSTAVVIAGGAVVAEGMANVRAAGNTLMMSNQAASREARFVADSNGAIVDTHATPPGSYDQPNGGRTDILQGEDHGSGRTHTHQPIHNVNPKNGQTFINGQEKTGTPVTAAEVKNIQTGVAPRSPPKGR